jgi:Family of unknown function (DUF6174)
MPQPQQSYRWVWYFVVLGVLTIAACTILVWYNLRQQLKKEDLQAAHALWNKNRPLDYDLTYTKRGSASGNFFVKVRGGKVVDVTLDGREITQNDKPLDPSRYSRYDMDALMDDIETFLEEDAEPGRPRTYTVATFDPTDGHLIRYVRRVMGSSERIEINVQLRKLAEPEASNRQSSMAAAKDSTWPAVPRRN